MIKINKQQTKSFLLYLILMLPVIAAYLYIFVASMKYSKDRSGYLQVMDVDAINRMEPLLPLIARVLNVFFEGGYVIKLIVIQLFFFMVLLTALYKYFSPYNLSSLTKSLLALMLMLLVTAIIFGVQLRIGYATIIFIYLIVSLKRFKLTSYIFIPFTILMHYGVTFAVLIYFYISILKINNRKKFIKHSVILLLIFTVFFKNIDMMFSLLGLTSYYYSYLSGEIELGREIPYTAVFYILNVTYLIFFHRNLEKDKFYWFSLSGLWLLYIGFFLQFYLAFKMLIPMIIVSIMCAAKSLPSDKHKNTIVYLLALYIISPMAFYYLATTTNLKLF